MKSNEETEAYVKQKIPSIDDAERATQYAMVPKLDDVIRVVVLCDCLNSTSGNVIRNLKLDKFVVFKLTAMNVPQNRVISHVMAQAAPEALGQDMKDGNGELSFVQMPASLTLLSNS